MNSEHPHPPAAATPVRDAPTTTCPTCGGVGKELLRAVLYTCEDCGGEGRVPAVWAYDWYGASVLDEERWPPQLIPIPKEFRP